MRVDVRPGTVTVFADVVCPWSTVALHRFYLARAAAGLDGMVHVDHQLYPLEEVSGQPTTKRNLDAEIAVAAALVPELKWRPWKGDVSAWPITSLLPNEAVHAAKRQSLPAAEELDMALRQAFFRDSRPISLLREIIDISGGCELVDAEVLRRDLETGAVRAAMLDGYHRCADTVRGAPHFFLVNGDDVCNPGVRMHFHGDGDSGAGFSVIDEDNPFAFDVLVRRAAH